MSLVREDWKNMFEKVSDLMIENKDILSEIDAKFGDGDHGVTIEKIGNVIKEKTSAWYEGNEPIKALFTEIGDAVTNISGGSAGPLYGTYFSGLGECLSDEVEVDAATLKNIIKSGLDELKFLTKAKVGDKTMMDTLIPATEAAVNAPGDIEEILKAAYKAAEDGAENSKNFASKFGRARSYKEATIGTPDAGAVSCTYIFRGFCEAVVK